jgi:hypothetical protein
MAALLDDFIIGAWNACKNEGRKCNREDWMLAEISTDGEGLPDGRPPKAAGQPEQLLIHVPPLSAPKNQDRACVDSINVPASLQALAIWKNLGEYTCLA